MLHIALWEPEIPPNTGNIARLCAATGIRLHLVGKLGFRMDDASLRRAGIDYWHAVDVVLHADLAALAAEVPEERWWLLSAHASRPYTEARFRAGDLLLFGCESKGLPASVTARFPDKLLTIPMMTGHVRSLNLSTSAGIVAYEALRQLQIW